MSRFLSGAAVLESSKSWFSLSSFVACFLGGASPLQPHCRVSFVYPRPWWPAKPGCVLLMLIDGEGSRTSGLSWIQAAGQVLKYLMPIFSDPDLSEYSSSGTRLPTMGFESHILPGLSLNLSGVLCVAYSPSRAVSCGCLPPSPCGRDTVGTLRWSFPAVVLSTRLKYSVLF